MDKVEEVLVEFGGILWLKVGIYVEDVFFFWVDFRAVEVGFVDVELTSLDEFFIDFWQICIKWLLQFLLVVLEIGDHQLSEAGVLVILGFEFGVAIIIAHY